MTLFYPNRRSIPSSNLGAAFISLRLPKASYGVFGISTLLKDPYMAFMVRLI